MRTIGICVVPGCENKKYAADICAKHWVRVRKYGDVNYIKPMEERAMVIKAARNNIESKYYLDAASGCWIWKGHKDHLGYGRLHGEYGRYKNGGGTKSRLAHRFVFEKHNGPIAPGLDLDHLCRNPSCVNPSHLEAVTHGENIRRGNGNGFRERTHCNNGHAYTPDNVKVRANGVRVCRTCMRLNSRKLYRLKHGIPIDSPLLKTPRK